MRSLTAADPMKPAPPVTRSFTRILARSGETLFAVDDRRKSGVLGCQECVAGRTGPFDVELLAKPVQAPFMAGRVAIVHFVGDDRIGLQRAKAMREAGRDQQLLAALGGELRAERAAEARAAQP